MLDKLLVSDILYAATSTGAEFAEVFVENNKKNSLGLINGKLERALSGIDFGIGIRIINKDRMVYVYTNKKDDKKYTEIVNVLDQYSYHFTTKTLTNSSQMSDSSKPQMIMLFGNKMLVISDSGEILLDNHVYRMGYSGGKDAKKMMKSINKILKSE